MFFHVGIDPDFGYAAVYNVKSIGTNHFEITTEIDYKRKNEDVEKMFKEIKMKVNGKLGYACIYLHQCYGNEIRKSFIEKGKEIGFLNVQTINWNMLIYLNYITQISQRPINGDIIWIHYYGTIYIWKKLNLKAKFVKKFEFETSEKFNEIMKKEKSNSGNGINPDILINETHTAPDLTIIKTSFPKCKCFETNKCLNISEAALIKGVIFAKDEVEVLDFDVEAQIGEDIDVKINENIVMSINEYESLPFEQTVSTQDDSEKVFKIFVSGKIRDELKVSRPIGIYKPYEILVKIDENGIIKIENVKSTIDNIKRQLAIEYAGKEINKSEYWIFQYQNKNPDHFLTSFEKPKKITTNDFTMGIDLGTTRCFTAVSSRNGINIIALGNTGERPLPSYVSFSNKIELCGQIVVNRLQQNAKFTAFDTKRIIGKDFADLKINKIWPFKVINEKNNPLIEMDDGKVKKAPEEIAAVLLKHIKQKAEEFQGKELDEVVITIPAAFNQTQKMATHVAALLAGWKTVHFLMEPIAASIAYFIDRPIPSNFNLLLFDLGGGTLEISIFKIVKEKLKIEAIHGDENLGGRDFDKLLFDHFTTILEKKFNVNVKKNDSNKYRLMQKSMEIKHTLSSETETSFDVSEFNSKGDEFLHITRQEFEKMASHLLNRIKETLIESLSKSNYISCDINKVLLVGGGCRMPMIKTFLLNMFKKAEFCSDEHPDEIVAIGAAYYASFLKSQNNSNCSIM